MPLDLSKLTDKVTAQRAINAAFAIAVGVLAVKVATDDPQRETKLADLGSALASGSATPRQQRADNLDTGELHRVTKAIRTQDPQLVDLGGMLVQPGATVEAGANLAKGSQLVAWQAQCEELGGVYQSQACILGPDAATWAVTASSCEDREDATWCEVTATNNGKQASRLLVLVRVAP